MNGIHSHTLSVALALAVISAVLTEQFGFSAIEALIVCTLGALTVSVVLLCVACILNGSSEPLRSAFEVVKREAGAIVTFIRNAIGS